MQWKSKGMIPLRDLRSLAGKLSWVAGVIPRIRWTVAIFYAVLSTAEREEQEGIEAARAAKREDKREKKGLVAVKRLGIARAWLERLFKKPDTLLIKIEPPQEPIPEFVLITDACPLGLGGILCKISSTRHKSSRSWKHMKPPFTQKRQRCSVSRKDPPQPKLRWKPLQSGRPSNSGQRAWKARPSSSGATLQWR